MGAISRKQLLLLMIVALLLYMESVFIISPLTIGVTGSVKTLYFTYGKNIEDLFTELEQKHKVLIKKKKNIEKLASSENSSAKWYDFLQTLLKKHNIPAERINSTGVILSGELDVEEFSFNCKSTYPKIVEFIKDIENSDFVCSIKNVHFISKSLLKNELDIDITVLFYKKHK